MKRRLILFLFLSLTVFTSCTTGSRNPSSTEDWEKMDKQIERLDHHLHRSGVI
ncbi:hypothetical protein [Halobacteriovorax sp. JY17]|uniref:hypothetical protein n=1 Tax=Halobacteriovorax sp. JY17 TaxID=2014617 RepID=UPI0025B9ECDF|nr:hypothetical protein [Halobacteriovorax sp. JY17]